MNKTLIIIRHGKSDWSFEDLPDYDRPLKSRGYHDAFKMAQKLKKYPQTPELIYTSPANRALYTSVIFSRVLFDNFKSIEILEGLYMASAEKMLSLIHNCDNHFNSLALFSHNPGVTDLANHFLPFYIDNIPTSGFVRLQFTSDDWKELGKKNLKKHDFEYPKKRN